MGEDEWVALYEQHAFIRYHDGYNNQVTKYIVSGPV